MAWGLVLASAPAVAGHEAVWCHEVRRGESLTRIAGRYGTTVATLRRLNGLKAGQPLLAGRRLALPSLTRLERGDLPLPSTPRPARPGALARENAAADRQDLSRLRHAADVARFRRLGLLVPLREATHTFWVDGVPSWRRVARPWTRLFVRQLAAGFHELFGGRLKITGLTRTPATQRALAGWNGNAAPAAGAVRSTHLTGASVDVSKQPLSLAEVRWLRVVLSRLAGRGFLHAVEEFVQPHFHVMVYRQYEPYGRHLDRPVLIGGC